MPRVLLVERSDTLRHVVGKLLRAAGHHLDSVAGYRDGREKLLAHDAPETEYLAVVMGWPKHDETYGSQLLELLDSPPFKSLGVILMTQEIEPALHAWSARRGNVTPILWENYQHSLAVLTSLADRRGGLVGLDAATDEREIPIRVLLVDDSPSVRRIYRDLLSGSGYETETAYSVEEGYRLARQHAFDIAIIDYFMPDQNGDVLVRKLRSNPETEGIHCAILTATYLEQVIHDALDAGALECMFKDESEELFLARVRSIAHVIRARKAGDTERHRLAGILSSVGDGVYGVNNDGVVTFVNPAARRILGYADDDGSLDGQMAHAVFHYAHEDGTPKSPETCFLCRAYGSGNELHCWETVFWQRAGTPIPVECTIFPLHVLGRLEGSVVAFRDISDRKGIEELRWQASHDPLTELYNRRHFLEQLEAEIIRVKRSSECSAVLYLDLDRFKLINDVAGHAAGDHLLVEVGRALSARLRDSDMLARIGGDEFGVLLRNIEPRNIYYVANSFREVLQHSNFHFGGRTLRVHGSIGVTLLNKNVQALEEVFEDSNIACQMAKRKGRNQTYVYVDDGSQPRAEGLESGWSARLREALDRDGFRLFFQPILPLDQIDCDDLPQEDGEVWRRTESRLTGRRLFEVLVRLAGPNGEMTPPHLFLPSAERFDLMKEIDLWVLTNATKKLAALSAAGEEIDLSINLSSRTLEDTTLLHMVRNLLDTLHLDPHSLIFEVTETSAITNLNAAQRFMESLRALGCRFALDDFGSGFSSFTYLKHLPVDYIKIDGQFVQDMVKDSVDCTMVTHMNQIAHTLGRKTIAEYVESAQVLKLLRECGVDWVQGNYVSRPREGVHSDSPVEGYSVHGDQPAGPRTPAVRLSNLAQPPGHAS